MTICIAAHARHNSDPCVVCCFDSRVETETAGSEIGFKLQYLVDGWGALFAGPASDAEDLIAKYRHHLKTQQRDEGLSTAEWLCAPAWKYKKFLIEKYLRSFYGISSEDFFSDSRGNLGDNANHALNQIADIQSQCQLILFRVVDTFSEIYKITSHFEVISEDNFCSIGTGATNADSWLYFRGQNRYLNRDDTIYALFEAKKFSENLASGRKN